MYSFVCFWRDSPLWDRISSFTRFLDHTHSNASHLVGLLWTSDQLVAETSTCQPTTLTTDKHPCPRWDSNPAVLVEQLYTGLMGFVGWSLVLNCTDAHGGILNMVNKLCHTILF